MRSWRLGLVLVVDALPARRVARHAPARRRLRNAALPAAAGRVDRAQPRARQLAVGVAVPRHVSVIAERDRGHPR